MAGVLGVTMFLYGVTIDIDEYLSYINDSYLRSKNPKGKER